MESRGIIGLRMRSTTALLLLLLLATVVDYASGFSRSVPTSACQSMEPSHGAAAQTTAPPYRITASAACYTPGQPITVTLSGASSSASFRGFLVEARLHSSNAASVGTFSTNNDADIQTVACFGRPDSAVSHTDDNDKSFKSFLWTPSSGLSGQVVITSTVVDTKRVFWVGVKTTVEQCNTGSIGTTVPAGNTTRDTGNTAVVTGRVGTTTVSAPGRNTSDTGSTGNSGGSSDGDTDVSDDDSSVNSSVDSSDGSEDSSESASSDDSSDKPRKHRRRWGKRNKW